MGDIIISNDFVDLGTITSISETAGYDDDNVEDYWHLKRRYRATGMPKSDTDFLLKFDFGSAQSVVAVVLNDVNFDTTRIRAHTADLGNNWAASDFDSGSDQTVSEDERVGRYKIYIPAVFSKRWMVVQVPAGAGSEVGRDPAVSKWEVGSVVVLDSVSTFAKNAYSRSAVKPFEDIKLKSGGYERIGLGSNLGWEGVVTIDTRAESDESELWALNALDNSKPLIFYENRDETDKVYLCLRDDAYKGNLVHQGLVTGNTMKFKELV